MRRWNDLAPNAYTSSFEAYNVLFIANHVIESEVILRKAHKIAPCLLHFLLVNLYGQPYTKEELWIRY